jgi:hypothetical protein
MFTRLAPARNTIASVTQKKDEKKQRFAISNHDLEK